MQNLKNLKSGSDIRGIALGENINLTNDAVKSIAMAFVKFLEKNKNIAIKNQTIAVGHDSRLSGERLRDIFINGLISSGANVYYCGLCSTPAMSMAPKMLSCSASVEITASHQPKEYNGFKFFDSVGGFTPSNIEEILNIASNEFYPKFSTQGTVRNIDFMKKYADIFKNMIKKEFSEKLPLEGLKIVIDASNGAGGFFADILKKLGADTSGSSLLSPDGNFPVHAPNPEKIESINYIKSLLMENKADLGIIFDADVDRCFFIDENGEAFSKSKLIALVSKLVLKEHPGSVIVTDSVTSDNLKNFIEKNGGYQFRERRGYQNIISAAKYMNKDEKICFLAIETSGHAAFEENNFKDDGAYLAAKIIIELAKLKKQNKKLSDEISDFQDAKETKEIRIPLENSEQIKKNLKNFQDNYKKILGCSLDKDTPEGVRLNFNLKDRKGWCLLRPSVHDMSLVLNIESDTYGGMEKILQDISVFDVDK